MTGTQLISKITELKTKRLNDLNLERRAIESLNVEQAFSQVQSEGEVGPAIVVQDQHWHVGVIGLVASRLTERYKRPAFVVAFDGNIGKGSARSIPNIDVGAMITAAHQAGLLMAGGGHSMAGGFTIQHEKFDDFRNFIEKRAVKLGCLTAAPSLGVDCVLALSAAQTDLVEKFEQAGGKLYDEDYMGKEAEASEGGEEAKPAAE